MLRYGNNILSDYHYRCFFFYFVGLSLFLFIVLRCQELNFLHLLTVLQDYDYISYCDIYMYIWNRNLLKHYYVFNFTFEQFNGYLLNKSNRNPMNDSVLKHTRTRTHNIIYKIYAFTKTCMPNTYVVCYMF